jgi:hypothetical protein
MAKKMRRASTMRATMYEKAAKVKAIFSVSSISIGPLDKYKNQNSSKKKLSAEKFFELSE